MQQQLIEQTIQILPATMNEVIPKIVHILSQATINEQILQNVVKSLFYGLWNFDKMINQHNLSTAIAQMLTKIPKKNAFAFLNHTLKFLRDKWNFIDHHRINKFMQLTRYLIKQALKISPKKTDQALIDSVFSKVYERSGIADYVTDIYFDCACEAFVSKSESKVSQNQILPWSKLQLFERLLKMQGSLQQFRMFIIEKVYEKYKSHIIKTLLASNQQNPEIALDKLQQFNKHIIQTAKIQQKDVNRRSLYTLVGFIKSDHELFQSYMTEKKQKIQENKQKSLEKKKKKISKGKKKQLKQAKTKRKQKKKNNKKDKVISKSKFEFKARQKMQQIMD